MNYRKVKKISEQKNKSNIIDFYVVLSMMTLAYMAFIYAMSTIWLTTEVINRIKELI